MEKKNPSNDEGEEKLPFSFKKAEVSSEKIKEHWQRIANKIAEANELPACETSKTNRNSEN